MTRTPHNGQDVIENGQDVIFIDNLLVAAHIGILDSEKGRAQPVSFDVEIRMAPGYRRTVEETGRLVSYADTVAFIQEKARSGAHVDLVEDWAEAVAGFVLKNPLADQVTVKVSKPDGFKEADGVGVRITRKRAA